jgi:NTP-dependent ternary system trypsin peptidase co-occuring protein
MSDETKNHRPTILIETVGAVSPRNSRSLEDVGFKEISRQVVEISSDVIQQAANELSKIAEDMLAQIKKASPDEVELELGLKVGIDTRVLVSLKGDANFNIKMKWTDLNGAVSQKKSNGD